MIRNLDDLYSAVREREAKTIAIAAAEDAEVISLVKKCLEQRIARFILVGDAEKIRALLLEEQLDGTDIEISNQVSHKEAAAEAVRMVVEKKAQAVMKGNLQTATFLKAVLDKQKGLNSGSLISQITVCEKIEGEGLMMITDCAMTISPNLEEKKQIIENAVELARKIGYETPRVAILSAVEVVNPAIPDTLDAAVLSKMADRGQIKNAVVDGPFALDNAISTTAARQKKIGGEVAGKADIVLVPNLQVGNPIHKALTYVANKKIAAAVMGGTAPIVMTSRADSTETMLLSIALAAYIS